MGGWPKSSKQNGEKGAQLLRCTVAGWGFVRAHKIDSVNALEEFIGVVFEVLFLCPFVDGWILPNQSMGGSVSGVSHDLDSLHHFPVELPSTLEPCACSSRKAPYSGRTFARSTDLFQEVSK